MVGATTRAALAGAALAVHLSACAGFAPSPARRRAPPPRRPAPRGGRADARPLAPSTPCHPHHHCSTPSSLSMGLLDYINEKFLSDREGDFIPLEQDDEDAYGPGPVVLLYAVPDAMDDEEFRDMIDDGMPNRAKEGVIIRRLAPMDANEEGGDALLDLTVGEALEEAMRSPPASDAMPSAPTLTTPVASSPQDSPCPVLYFSGVTNAEMMDTYRIIANEIYDETGGIHWPACAKAVKPAKTKSLRRVLAEISGDHAEAMRMRREGMEGGAGEEEGG